MRKKDTNLKSVFHASFTCPLSDPQTRTVKENWAVNSYLPTFPPFNNITESYTINRLHIKSSPGYKTFVKIYWSLLNIHHKVQVHLTVIPLLMDFCLIQLQIQQLVHSQCMNTNYNIPDWQDENHWVITVVRKYSSRN